MIRNIASVVAQAVRRLAAGWRLPLVFVALFAALLGSLYLFIAIRQATVIDVVLTLVMILLAPIFFFVMEELSISYARESLSTGVLIKRSLREFWKLIVIAIPLVVIAILFIYLINKIRVDAPAVAHETARTVSQSGRGAAPAAKLIDWKFVGVTALRYLVFGIALPLAAIHLWIASAKTGLGKTLKNSARIVARGFLPRSVLTYSAGLAVFGVAPYLLLFTKTLSDKPWLELALLGGRLTACALLMLFGWVITNGALSQLADE